MRIKTVRKKLAVLVLILSVACQLVAQQVLSLQDCRDMALENNKNLKISQEKVNIANYDKKIAFSNYLPKITAQGTYTYNEKQLQLLSDDKLSALSSLGSTLQGDINGFVDPIIQNLMQNPSLYEIIAQNPALLNLIQNIHHIGALEALDAIGSEIADQFKLDTRNVYAGMITIQEPVYPLCARPCRDATHNRTTGYHRHHRQGILADSVVGKQRETDDELCSVAAHRVG